MTSLALARLMGGRWMNRSGRFTDQDRLGFSGFSPKGDGEPEKVVDR
jgi:hypothetical protein